MDSTVYEGNYSFDCNKKIYWLFEEKNNESIYGIMKYFFRGIKILLIILTNKKLYDKIKNYTLAPWCDIIER